MQVTNLIITYSKNMIDNVFSYIRYKIFDYSHPFFFRFSRVEVCSPNVFCFIQSSKRNMPKCYYSRGWRAKNMYVFHEYVQHGRKLLLLFNIHASYTILPPNNIFVYSYTDVVLTKIKLYKPISCNKEI